MERACIICLLLTIQYMYNTCTLQVYHALKLRSSKQKRKLKLTIKKTAPRSVALIFTSKSAGTEINKRSPKCVKKIAGRCTVLDL